MGKRVPDHLRDRAGKCIFCGEPGLTHTHIFPDWLDELFRPPPEHVRQEGTGPDDINQAPRIHRQGSIFSQKPYLACGDCNGGWMNLFENAMIDFAKPLFFGGDAGLNPYQARVFAGWITLVTMCAVYIDKRNRGMQLAISQEERDFFRKFREPPPNWTVVAATLDGNDWYLRYKGHSTGIYRFNVPARIHPLAMDNMASNAQISSFGLGKIFVHVFSCQVERLIYDFRAAAKGWGLTQIWPIPRGFWPFTKRLPKFPTETTLKDDQAYVISDAFYKRIQILSRYG